MCIKFICVFRVKEFVYEIFEVKNDLAFFFNHIFSGTACIIENENNACRGCVLSICYCFAFSKRKLCNGLMNFGCF